MRTGTDIAMVIGINMARADTMRRLGVPSVAALAAADPDELVEKAKAAGTNVSARQIKTFQHHARALHSGQPEWIGSDCILTADFIGLDLEYISGLWSYFGGSKRQPEIFLFGVVLERAGERTIFQRLITKKEELGGALRAFDRLVRDNPDIPIFTWNGTNADSALS
jgi:predicted RecB family nuclease